MSSSELSCARIHFPCMLYRRAALSVLLLPRLLAMPGGMLNLWAAHDCNEPCVIVIVTSAPSTVAADWMRGKLLQGA